MGELITRYKLLEEMNNKEIEMEFELPVQEILGKDVDMDDFCMLVQEIIKKYRELIVGVIRKQPTAYNVEKIVEEIETYINHYNNYESICVERGDKKEAHTFSCLSDGLCKALEIVRNGGSGYE